MGEMLSKDDIYGNTPLHYAYALHQPWARSKLRNYYVKFVASDKLATKPNKKGELPKEMGHNIKNDDSDDNPWPDDVTQSSSQDHS